MTSNPDNIILIDEYIQRNPNSKLNDSKKVKIEGEIVRITVYKIPIKLMNYNIQNGRFKKEYASLIKKNGGSLNPLNPAHRKQIQNLLLTLGKENWESNSDTVKTYNDLAKEGQLEPAISTHDGFLLDGNRRMAVLELLHQTKFDSKFEYIEVARIPGEISNKDMYRIEASISLGMDSKVKYGPLNILLKVEEGLELEYSASEISDMLYGDITDEDILKMMDRLRLIRKYLMYHYKEDDDLELVEGKHEHFIELQKIGDLMKNKSLFVKQQIQHACFNAIKSGISSDRIRMVNRALNQDFELETLLHISKMIPGESKEPSEEEDEIGDIDPIRTQFGNFEDEVRLKSGGKSISVLLTRIVNAFKVLKIDEIDSNDADTKQLSSDIFDWVKKLKTKYE